MKIFVVGDDEKQQIDVVRLDSMEEAHSYYLDKKDITLGHLEQIASCKDIPSLYRRWVREAADLIKMGEF